MDKIKILENLQEGISLEEQFETEEEYQAALTLFSGYNKTAYTPEAFFETIVSYLKRMKRERIVKYDKNGDTYGVQKPMTKEGFCDFANMTTNQFDALVKNPKFSGLAEGIKTKISADIIENGLVGNYSGRLVEMIMGMLDAGYKKDAVSTNITINLPCTEGMTEKELRQIIEVKEIEKKETP